MVRLRRMAENILTITRTTLRISTPAAAPAHSQVPKNDHFVVHDIPPAHQISMRVSVPRTSLSRWSAPPPPSPPPCGPSSPAPPPWWRSWPSRLGWSGRSGHLTRETALGADTLRPFFFLQKLLIRRTVIFQTLNFEVLNPYMLQAFVLRYQ